MRFELFTAENCAPCKGIIAYLNTQYPELEYSLVYHHIRPDLFQSLGVRATPTLVGDGQIVALGYDNIINYVKGLTWFDVSESIKNYEGEEE